MVKSRVIDIFKTFSANEIKGFRNFINSPIHNSNKKVIKLYDLIRIHYPEFNSEKIQKEILFKKLYPAKKYSDIVMRILISDMLSLAEEFLAYTGFTKDFIAGKKYLLKELDQRKLDKLFTSNIKETEQDLEKEGIINSAYFLNRFDIESARYDNLISSDRQDRSGSVLEKQGEYLVDFFLINGMNILQQMYEMSEVVNQKYEINLPELIFNNLDLDKFIKELKKKKYKYYPVIEIYYLLLGSINNIHSSEHHEKLKNAIINNMYLFDEAERYNLLLAYESCAVTRIRHGIKKSKEDLMEVYELILEKMSFSGSNKRYMQANLYRNIFYTALMLKKLKWAEEFTLKYADYLLPEQKADMFNYTRAMLCFERNRFEEALELIAKVNYTFFVYKYEARIIMLKTYYELNSIEQALSLVDSFSHFLTKNRNVSPSYKEPFLIFLRFLKILIKQKMNSGNKSEFIMSELLAQAESAQHFMSKAWILEKIKQLK